MISVIYKIVFISEIRQISINYAKGTFQRNFKISYIKLQKIVDPLKWRQPWREKARVTVLTQLLPRIEWKNQKLYLINVF